MRRALLCLALVATTAPAAKPKKPPPLPDELALSGDNIIEAEIAGRKMRLEVRPNAPTAPTLNPAVAAELRFKPGMFGFIVNVGPVKVRGASAVKHVNYGKAAKQRVFWADHPVSAIADGVISPESLPYKRVRFILSAPLPGEVPVVLPIGHFGFLGRGGMATSIRLGEEDVKIQFTLSRALNLTSAPTGNRIAEYLSGKLIGAAVPVLVYYDIERPARPMALERPMVVGPFAISQMHVRVQDYGDATGIKEADAPPVDADSEEAIIVTAKRKKRDDLFVTLGRNALNGCSSMTYDLEKEKVRLSCRP